MKLLCCLLCERRWSWLKFPRNRSPGEFYQRFRKEFTPCLWNSSKKSQRNTSKLILWGYHNTKIKDSMKKLKYKLILLITIDAKILNKILANQIQQYIKWIIHHDKMGFIPGLQGFLKSTNQSVWYITLTNWRLKAYYHLRWGKNTW